MSLNSGQKLKKILTAFLICGTFLFVFASKNVLAVNDYNKISNGTLTSIEWNNLKNDFVNTWETIRMNGPLGINTTTPVTPVFLAVGGDITANSGLFFGSVGIGDPSPADSLSVVGNISGTGLKITSSGANFITGSNLTVGNAGGGASKLSIFGNQSIGSTYYGYAAPANSLIVEGNVGIGTTTPNSKLNVYGTSGDVFTVSGPSGNTLVMNNSGNATLSINDSRYAGTGKISLISEPGGNKSSVLSSGRLILGSDNSEAMRIVSGNVGIGTTTPNAKLQVMGSVNATGLCLSGDCKVAWSDIVTAGGGNQWITSGTNIYNANYSTGNVGIGTTGPLTVLHVVNPFAKTDTTDRDVTFVSSNEATASHPFGLITRIKGGASTEARTVSLQVAEWGGSYGGNLSLQESGGNVGIGTTNPGKALDVNGDIRVNNTNNIGWWNSANSGGSGSAYYAARITKTSSGYSGNMQFYTRFGGDNVEALALTLTSPSSGGTQALFPGKVGIGTTTPMVGTALHIVGTTLTTGLAFSGNPADVKFSWSDIVTAGGGNQWITSGIDIYNANYSTGNVGIGSAAAATDKLAVVGNIAGDSALKISGSAASNWLSGNVGVGNASIGSSKLSIFGNQSIGTGYFSNAAPANGLIVEGNVGIGTTVPADVLHVVDTNGGFFFDGSNASYNRFKSTAVAAATGKDLLFSAQDAGTTPDLYIKSNGYVGIGTTDPGVPLEVVGQVTINNGTLFHYTNTDNAAVNYIRALKSRGTYASPSAILDGDDVLRIEGNSFTSGTTYGYSVRILGESDGGSGVGSSPGKLSLWTTPTGAASVVERLTIRQDGNVGIGTTTPNAKLQVMGSVNATGLCLSGDCKVAWSDIVTAGGGNQWITSGVNIYNANYSTGNVGIGSAAAATDKLAVVGNIAGDSALKISGSAASNWLSGNVGVGNASIGSSKLSVFGNQSIGTGYFSNAAPANGLIVEGNVGIGTTGPGAILDVQNNQNASSEFRFSNTTAGTNSRARLMISSDSSAGNLSLGMHSSTRTTDPNQAWIFASGVSTPLVLATVGTARMLIDTTGNIGIGTAAPYYPLDINGNSNITGTLNLTGTIAGGTNTVSGIIRFNGQSAPGATVQGPSIQTGGGAGSGKRPLYFYQHNSADYTTEYAAMTLLANGNVGIGTTTPNAKLQVYGAVNATGLCLSGDCKTAWSDIVTAGGGNQWITSGVNIYNANYSTGNVGIGSAAAATDKLAVVGNIAGDSALKISGSAASNWLSGNVGIGNASIGSSKLSIFGNQSIGTGYFSTAAPANGLIVEGNVGIGTTNPQTSLHVYGANANGIKVERSSAQNSNIQYTNTIGSTYAGLSAAANFAIGPNLDLGSSPWMTIASSTGNVGIGTTAPLGETGNDRVLHVNNSGNYSSELKLTNNVTGVTATDGLMLQIGSSGGAYLWQYENNILQFGTNNSAAMTILATGNVGIGTTTPNAKLQVYGAVNATGLCLSGDCKTAWSDIVTAGGGNQWITSGTNIYNANYSTGNVGIGSASAATDKLAVVGNIAGDSALKISGSAASNWLSGNVGVGNASIGSSKLSIFGNQSIGSGYFSNAAPANGLIVEGNVGIGTSTPRTIFEISKNSSGGSLGTYPAAIIDNPNAAGYAAYMLYNGGQQAGGLQKNTDNSLLLYTATTTSLQLATNNAVAMTILSGGNVGIGTTAPNAKLSFGTLAGSPAVYFYDGGASTRHGIGVQGAELQSFVVNDSHFSWNKGGDLQTSGTNELMRLVASSGNVGIGTSTPNAKLQVMGSVNATGLCLSGDCKVAWSDIVTAGGGNQWITSGVNIYNANYSTGNVGIGSASAATDKLAVVGNIAGDSALKISGSAASNWLSGNVGIGNASIGSSKLSIFGNQSIGTGYFSTAAPANGLIVEGNVGIGTTSPAALLEVNAGVSTVIAKFRGAGNERLSVYQAAENDWRIYPYDDTDSLYKNLGLGGSGQAVFIKADGNVGIGTTGPGDHLSIEGTGSQSLSIYSTDTGVIGTPKTFIKLYGENTLAQQRLHGQISTAPGANSNSGDMIFSTSNTGATITERMRILGDGNVGIGTTNPLALLDITKGVGTSGLELQRWSYSTAGDRWNLRLHQYTSGDDVIWSFNQRDDNTEYSNVLAFKNGKVGIGTTSPMVGTALHIVGTTLTTGLAFSGNPADVKFSWSDIVTAGGGNQWITSGVNIYNANYSTGNVGIGTTAAATDKLAVVGNIAGDSALKISGSAASNWLSGNVGVGNASIGSSKLSVFGNQSIGTGYFSTAAPANGLIVEGNVGIGTTGPVTKLDIYADTNAANVISVRNPNVGTGAFAGIFIGNDGATNRGGIGVFGSGYSESSLYKRDGTYIYNNGSGGISVHSEGASGFVRLGANNTEGLRVIASGNVGIGTTNPLAKLEVSGAAALGNGTYQTLLIDGAGGQGALTINSVNSATHAYQTFAQGGVAKFEFGIVPTSGDFYLNNTTQVGSNNAALYILKSTGNVGIGTTAPGSPLEISKQTTWGNMNNPIININNSGTGGDINQPHNMGSITWQSGNVPTAAISAIRNTPASGNNVELRFTTASAGTQYERMTIDSTGKVGIGTTTPMVGTALHVVGTTLTTGLAFSGNPADVKFSWSDIVTAGGGNQWITSGVNIYNANYSTGNVGIGSASAATDKLAVVGNIAGDSALKISGSAASNWLSGNVGVGNASIGSSKLSIFGNQSIGTGYFSTAAPAGGLIVEGNVGIGTTVPATKLDVNGIIKSTGSISNWKSNRVDPTALRYYKIGVVSITGQYGTYQGTFISTFKQFMSAPDISVMYKVSVTQAGMTGSPVIGVMHYSTVSNGGQQIQVKAILITDNSSLKEVAIYVGGVNMSYLYPGHGVIDQDVYGSAAFNIVEHDTGVLSASLPAGTQYTMVPGITTSLNGEIGIGTANPANYKLVIAGNGAGSGFSAGLSLNGGQSGGNYDGIGYNFRNTATTNVYNYNIADTSSRLEFTAGGFRFDTAPAGTIGNPITYTTAMTILQGGKVGIGTTSPMAGTALHVVGTTLTTGLAFSGNPADVKYSWSDIVTAGGGNQWITSGTNIYNSNYSTGNVGIGSASAATDKLAVVGNIAGDSALKISGSAASNWLSGNVGVGNASIGASKLSIFGNQSIGSGYFSNAAPANGLIVEGNVGIGTTDTGLFEYGNYGGSLRSQKLLVYGSSVESVGIESGTNYSRINFGTVNTTASPDIISAIQSNVINRTNNAEQSTLEFYTKSGAVNTPAQVKMTILGNGNVGIGTTAPGTKLDVNGVITATGGNSTQWNTAYASIASPYEGRNLVKASKYTVTGTGAMRSYTLSEPLQAGVVYTATLAGITGSGASFNIWVDGPNQSACNLGILSPGGRHSNTFTFGGGYGQPSTVWVYSETSANPSTVWWIKIERGTVATDWTPAPEDMTWSAGNVGIGTTTPNTKLQVMGSVNATGLCLSGDCKVAWADIVTAGGGNQWITSGTNIYNSNYSTGNVGIGSASAATDKLAVVGNIAGDSALKISGSASSNWLSGNVGIGNASIGSSKLSIFGNQSIGSGYFSNAAPAGGLIVEGNVGIGTTVPNYTLEVAGPVYGTTIAGYGKDGSSQALAAYSCKLIKQNYSQAADGTYWIDPTGGSTSDAFQTYCDMTNGGWTRVAYLTNGGAVTNNMLDKAIKFTAVRAVKAADHTVYMQATASTPQTATTGLRVTAREASTNIFLGLAGGFGIYQGVTGVCNWGTPTIMGAGYTGTCGTYPTNMPVGQTLNSTVITSAYDVEIFAIEGAPVTIVDIGGNVGINDTNPTTAKLSVVGDIASSLSVRAAASASSNWLSGNTGIGNASIGASKLSIFGNQSIGTGYFSNAAPANSLIVEGNVGIGTTAPNAKLSFGTLVGSPEIYFYDGGASVRHGIGVQGAELQSFIASDSHFSWNKGGDLQTSGTNELMRLVASTGNVGIGTTNPTNKLYVNGTMTTTGSATLSGGITMGSATTLNVNGGSITAVNKITADVVDPLYNIKGTNYSTFASSIAGGLKEEYVGRISASAFSKKDGYFEATIDLAKEKSGSDLWVWYHVIEFNDNNVEVFLTPRNGFASTYSIISGTSIIVRSDRPADLSMRLVGSRFDWRKWPTKPLDQTEKASLIIK